MREVGAFEAKNTFGTLLNLVEKGEEIIITRRGKSVARLIPDLLSDKSQAIAAAARIISRSKGVTLRMKGGVKALIHEGRK